MSLAFLAKKSWHTANLRNVEKVWIAEQKHAAEEKKLAELKKNIEEERQMQELRKLQAAHGNKQATIERLDWMYQGPMASSATERTTEEYLLGKEYKPDQAGSDARKLDDSAYGALAMTKAVLPSNDAFSRLNEDPMMLIRSQQKRAQEDILKNPVKMKKIKGQVEKILKDKKEKKKAKKAKKKERKHGKREKSRRSRSASIDSSASDRSDSSIRDREQHKRHSRHAILSPRHDHEDVRSRHDGHRTRSPDRSERRRERRSAGYDRKHRHERSPRSRSRSRERRSSHRDDKKRSPERYRSSSRGRSGPPRRRRSPSRDSFGRERTSPRRRNSHHERSPRPTDRSRDRDNNSHRSERRSRSRERRSHADSYDKRDTRARDGKGDQRASTDTKHRSRSNEAEPCRSMSPASRHYVVEKPNDGGKYGLIHQGGAVEAKNIDKTTLGPNTKFLERAREKKRQEEEELRRKLSKTSRTGSTLSHDDMVKEAAKMAEDAKAREAYLTKQATEKCEKLEEEEAKLRNDPHFLKKLQDDAYIKGDSSMEDRLRRNSHYIQKRAGAGNFLSKD